MTQQYFFCATSRFALQGGCNFRKYTLILVSINLSNDIPNLVSCEEVMH